MSGIEAAMFGVLARDAEAKISKTGKQYLRFTLRVGADDSVQWVSVLAFDPAAIEAVGKMVTGARVYVEGTLSADKYTGKDGTERLGLTVMSWHCKLSQIGRNKVRSRDDGNQKVPASARGEPVGQSQSAEFDDEVPF